MIAVGDRVRIHRPRTTVDGATGWVVGVRRIDPRPGIVGSHQPISRLFTVRLDDGTLVEPPLLTSDLVALPQG